MKRRFVLIAALSVLCLIPVFCSSCIFGAALISGLIEAEDSDHKVSTKHSSVVFDLNELWGMEFPEGFTSAYVFYNRYAWFGEGEFFAVYNCERYNEEFFADFSKDYNEEVKKNINGYFEHFNYDEERYEIILDRTFQPDFDENFISISYHTSGLPDPIYTGEESNKENHCDDHLFMSYFPKTNTLYIYENIT